MNLVAKKHERFLNYLRATTGFKRQIRREIGDNHSFNHSFFEGNLFDEINAMSNPNALLSMYEEPLGRIENKKTVVFQDDFVSLLQDCAQEASLLTIGDLHWHDNQCLVEFWARSSPLKGDE